MLLYLELFLQVSQRVWLILIEVYSHTLTQIHQWLVIEDVPICCLCLLNLVVRLVVPNNLWCAFLRIIGLSKEWAGVGAG